MQSFENLSIRRKVLYSTVVMFLFIGILTTIANWFIFIPALTEQIQVRSLCVARSLVASCRSCIIGDNVSALTGILFQKKGIEKKLSYIFVTNAKNQVVAHTFINEKPEGIETANLLEPGENERVQLITVRGESVYDTAVSVKEGLKSIGTVHVGMAKKPVDAVTMQIGITLTVVVVVIILLASLLGSLVATYISRPLTRLTKAMNDLSMGKAQQLPRISREVQCWKIKKCKKETCPAYGREDLVCWLTEGTPGIGKGQKSPAEKMEVCSKCTVYKKLAGDEIIQLSSAFSNIINTLQLAAEEIKDSEEKYRVLFNYDPNPLFVIDIDTGKILDVNRPAITTYKYEREEMLDMSFIELFATEDSDQVWNKLQHLKVGEYVFLPKLWATKKNGFHFFVDLHASVAMFHGREGKGSTHYLIVRTVDITPRLEQEAHLLQASKMATLGEMATGIAHELNQPLNVMRIAADFLTKMVEQQYKVSEEQLLKVCRNASEQVDRAAKIINHLREFGRKSEFKVYPVDLNQPIRGVFGIIGQQLRLRNIQVNLKLSEALPKILADKIRVEQIFLNLITNARDAMDAKGAEAVKNLTITTRREGDRVVVLVSDTGIGIPKQIRQRIFEPFFTTKEVGKGTGLGLSITYNLVKDFNGDIRVESTSDAGTTIKLSFPVYEEKEDFHGKIADH